MNLEKLQIIHTENRVDKSTIERISQVIELPKSYLKLVEKINGFVEKKGIKLYSIDEIQERNETYEVKDYLPNYVAIGDDSGGYLFLMKADSSSPKVYISDSGTLFLDENEDVISDDLTEWVQNGCMLKFKQCEGKMEFCSVVLRDMPQGGIKDLLKIKKIFNCNISTGNMLSGVKKGSLTLVENITISKAKVLLNKLGDIEKNIYIIPKI